MYKTAASLRDSSPAQFADLSAFFIAFQTWVGKMGPEHPHTASGVEIIRRMKDPFMDCVEAYIDPYLESRAIQRIESARNGINRGSGGKWGMSAGKFAKMIFSRLHGKAKIEILHEIFKDKTRSRAAEIFRASKEKSPEAVIHKLAVVPSLSGIQKTRRWIREAANYMGVAPSDFEATLADAESAVNAAERVRELSQELSAMDPMDVRVVEVSNAKDEYAQQIQNIANDSPNPQVVLSAAVTEITQKKDAQDSVAVRLGLNAEQTAALMAEGKVVLGAAAGSGKTRVLAGKVAYAVEEQGYSPEQVLATSFTRKASKELAERCQSYTTVPLPSVKEGGYIGRTTHSIAASILSKADDPAMRNGLFKAADETVRDLLLQIALKQAQMGEDDIVSRFMKYLLRARQEIISNRMYRWYWFVQDRRTQQFEDNNGRMQGLLGGAIEFKLKRGQLPSEKQMTHLKKLFPEFGTFGNDFTDQDLLDFGKIKSAAGRGGKKDTQKESLIQGLRNSKWLAQAAGKWFNIGDDEINFSVKEASTFITRYKGASNDAKALFDSADDEKTKFGAAVWGAYEWLKGNETAMMTATKGNFAMDLEDMIWAVGDLLQGNPEIRKTFQSKFKVIMVDEAQDSNKAQHRMFEYLAGIRDPETDMPWEEEHPNRPEGGMTADTYMLIGDDKQSIYRFRSAEVEEFIDRSDAFGGDFKTMLLSMNYRSGSNIVEAANQLIKHNEKQIPMACKAYKSQEGEKGSIRSVSFGTHGALASYAADKILHQTSLEDVGVDLNHFGVAVRNNAEADAFEMAFVSRGILYRRKGSFFNKPVVKSIMSWMKFANTAPGPERNRWFLDTIGAPVSYLGNAFRWSCQKVIPKGEDYFEWLTQNRLYPANENFKNSAIEHHLVNCRGILDAAALAAGKFDPELSDSGDAGNATPPGVDLMNLVIELEGFKGDTILKIAKQAEKEDAEAEGEVEVENDDETPGRTSEIEVLLGMFQSNPSLDDALSFYDKLVDNAEKAKKGDEDDSEPAVELLTAHGWKGLERESMFVVMTSGVFPSGRRGPRDEHGVLIEEDPMTESMEEYEARIQEERRLAYVALTRGKSSVEVLSSEENYKGRPNPEGGSSASFFVSEACIPTDYENSETGSIDAYDDVGNMGRMASAEEELLSAWGEFMITDERF